MDQIKKKILILGANGQVGKELCIYLKNFENCNIIASTRNNLSAYFLISHNINCVIGDIYNNEILKREIETSDLIFDLAAPSGGNLSEIKKNNISPMKQHSTKNNNTNKVKLTKEEIQSHKKLVKEIKNALWHKLDY